MYFKKCKKPVVAIIAIVAAILGVLIAVAAIIKKRVRVIGDDLDFDGDLYYEDDEPFIGDAYDEKFPEHNHCNCCHSGNKEPLEELTPEE